MAVKRSSCKGGAALHDIWRHLMSFSLPTTPHSTSGERQRGSRAAKQRHELAALHSRTSLARASDKKTPSEAAVLRLTAM
jgi:hypothetical protein